MRQIEIEVKEEKKSDGVCPMCGDQATKTILIGEVQDKHGSWHEVCDSKHCEDLTLDQVLETIEDAIKNAKEYRELDNYEYEKENA